MNRLILSINETVSETQICKTMESNPVFFETILTLLSIIITVVGIVVSIEKYVKKKQQEAQFGFYINFIVYLRNLYFYLQKYPEVTDTLIQKDIREDNSNTYSRIKAIQPNFEDLCKNFLSFISDAENNVPPNINQTSECGQWNENIVSLSDFLLKCSFISTGHALYQTKDEAENFRKDFVKITKTILNIDNQISEVLQIQSIEKKQTDSTKKNNTN